MAIMIIAFCSCTEATDCIEPEPIASKAVPAQVRAWMTDYSDHTEQRALEESGVEVQTIGWDYESGPRNKIVSGANALEFDYRAIILENQSAEFKVITGRRFVDDIGYLGYYLLPRWSRVMTITKDSLDVVNEITVCGTASIVKTHEGYLYTGNYTDESGIEYSRAQLPEPALRP